MTRRTQPPPARSRRGARAASTALGVLLAAAGVLAVGVATLDEVGSSIAAIAIGDTYGDDLSATPATGPPAATGPIGEPTTEIGEAAARATDPTVRLEPAGVQISSIDVSRFPIRSVGLTDDGALEVPDVTEIGWYRYGATPGRPGTTVLAAHVAWNGTEGPFVELGRLEPGASIEITLDDGSTRHYEVIERALYGKTELPRERIWRRTGDETLVLITCGGEFNPEIRRFRQNIVVYAVPVT